MFYTQHNKSLHVQSSLSLAVPCARNKVRIHQSWIAKLFGAGHLKRYFVFVCQKYFWFLRVSMSFLWYRMTKMLLLWPVTVGTYRQYLFNHLIGHFVNIVVTVAVSRLITIQNYQFQVKGQERMNDQMKRFWFVASVTELQSLSKYLKILRNTRV